MLFGIVFLFALLSTTAPTGTFIYPRLLESRNDDGNLLLYICDDLMLNLRKSRIIAKDFVITSYTETSSDNVIVNRAELERNLYHDTEHRSSLLVTRRESGVEVRGILNDKLRITPAVLAERFDQDLIPHEVFTVEERSSFFENGDTYGELQSVIHWDNASFEARNNSDCNETFVVELCVAVGSTYESAFNGTEELVTYIGTMVNASVNITGRNICGLTLNDMSNRNVCGADSLHALYATARLFQWCGSGHCDLVLQLTNADLAMYINETSINAQVKGLTFLGKVCTNYSASIAEDAPHTYSGVLTVAHEIAHSLGASHDGDNLTLPIDGYPNALNCSAEDGYLMKLANDGHKGLSNCTKAQIKCLVGTLTQSCIEVLNNSNYPNGFYPGQNMTLEKFCKNAYPQHKDVAPDRTSIEECKLNCCWPSVIGNAEDLDAISADYSDFYEDLYQGAAPQTCHQHIMPEAMPCGGNKTCRQGVCGDHNWTAIYNMYHTYRTFKTL
ncbi:venom metalloproteinase antarease TserMP_A-like isoform X2 [Rhipicephalus microplus]|uniref:venom metalloproteinase antarease TserMP_A-like isoform X2 n=1 Tax=Rhipicephalus microplus TaxID=6941 RepID=UPI003F6D33D3